MATVLIVDDDADVLSYLTEVLSDAGHDVISASSGNQALECLDDAPRVELLLTDIRMPDLNGFYLAHLAKIRRPSLKILYLSGYHDVEGGRLHVGERYGKLLKKPIMTAELRSEVAKALEP
ncbi:MAG: histidine kinase [Rhodospirillales bacterium]|jgi:DNA-binding NtrC family response regulator|nr:histidine kinase [Rhodospirillales bacterium]